MNTCGIWWLPCCHFHKPRLLSSHVWWFLLMHDRTSANSLCTYYWLHQKWVPIAMWQQHLEAPGTTEFPLHALWWSGYTGAAVFGSAFQAKTHPWRFQLLRDPEKSNCTPAETLDMFPVSGVAQQRHLPGPEEAQSQAVYSLMFTINLKGQLETRYWSCRTKTPFSFGPICFNPVLPDLIHRDEDTCSSLCEGRPPLIWE